MIKTFNLNRDKDLINNINNNIKITTSSKDKFSEFYRTKSKNLNLKIKEVKDPTSFSANSNNFSNKSSKRSSIVLSDKNKIIINNFNNEKLDIFSKPEM